MGGVLGAEHTTDAAALGDFSDLAACVREGRGAGPAWVDIARMRGAVHCLPEPRVPGELPLVTVAAAPAFEEWFKDLLAFVRDASADDFLLNYKTAAIGFPPEALEYDQSPLLRGVFSKAPVAAHTRDVLSCCNQGVMFSGFGALQAAVWAPWMNGEDWETRDWRIYMYYDAAGACTVVHHRVDAFRTPHRRQPEVALTWTLALRVPPAGRGGGGGGHGAPTDVSHELTLLSADVTAAWWSRTARQRAQALAGTIRGAWGGAAVRVR